MPHCSVLNCRYDSKNKCKKFRFPSNKVYANIWLRKCKKVNLNIDNARICAKHFKPEHFERNFQQELLGYSSENNRILKPDAIPTEYMPCNTLEITSEEHLLDLEEEVATANETESELQLRVENEEMKKEIQFLRKKSECMKKIFSPTQISVLRGDKRQIKWTKKELIKYMGIFANSPEVYRLLLLENHPLPSEDTLNEYLKNMDINPGFLHQRFKLMDKFNYTPIEKVCIIMSDEMKIKYSYEYEEKEDTFHHPVQYVQVILVQALYGNWTEPIYYNFDVNLTKDLLFEVIHKLENMDYHVVAYGSGLGPKNISLRNHLGITENSPFFVNPVDNTKKIYAFVDTPHLIKLLQNHLFDDGILFEKKRLTKEPLEELFKKQRDVDNIFDTHLINDHLNCQCLGRKNARDAIQMFSRTNSRSLIRYGEQELTISENWRELAVFIKFINDWFGIFNSSEKNIVQRNRRSAYGLVPEQHEEILNNTEAIIKNIRVGENEFLMPFQFGILTNISALRMLYDDLKRLYDISYLLTKKLNQDSIEYLFKEMHCSPNKAPTIVEFTYNFRLFQIKNSKLYVETNPKDIGMDRTVNSNISNNEKLLSVESNNIENLAGYLIKQLHTRIPAHILKSYCVTNSNTPNAVFIQKIYELNTIFNFNFTSQQIGVVKYLLSLSKNIDLEEFVKKLFFKWKIFFKIRSLNEKTKNVSLINSEDDIIEYDPIYNEDDIIEYDPI